jgi:phosphoglucosamine mutase
VLETRADLGIAFDGDGDRVVFVDAEGVERDGDDVLYVLATGAQRKPEGVVGTVMSNAGLEAALAQKNIAFVRTPVGDKYVMEKLLETGWYYGAEPSGHVLCMDRLNTGDGIVAALQVLSVLVRQGKTLQQALSGFSKYPFVLENVRLHHAEDKRLLDQPEWKVFLAEQEARLDSGRILVRPSGTEPLIRVMVEGQDERQIQDVVETLVQWIETRI